MSATKLILVIGATGAQGQAVIDALLAAGENGAALIATQAQALAARGVECVQGSFSDFTAVAKALDGAYGAWVNTDGSTVDDKEEIYAGMRIFEVAKQTRSLRHYVWSSLPYFFKKSGYDPNYKTQHADAKGRVSEWLSVQPSVVSDGSLSWSIGIFGPMNVRKDGTVVWAAPMEDGRVPMIALKDLGWWARWTFDHRAETSARELSIASEHVGWEQIAETFTKITGRPAVYKRLALDEWWGHFDANLVDHPMANEGRRGDGSMTIRENVSAAWRVFRDDLFDKDMEWIRSVHPGTCTLESWMRENNYDGKAPTVLKNALDGKNPWGLKPEVAALL
ncbi:NAD-P-binding protein [Mycena rosella]|uniref:NAD-P-binding protein n=1 Tax=Mycena rosella TaxID=1033263 RepID=A0AAD7FQJ8_MYCRO|nr:NAD-P-binding protein [Mycena rosella]